MTSSNIPTQARWGYNSFYKEVAVFPQLGTFRRFGPYWAKKLHDETGELRTRLSILNQEIVKCTELDARHVLDCPRWIAREKCPAKTFSSLHVAWDEYEAALVRYGEALCLSAKIMDLPAQDTINIRDLAQWEFTGSKPIFEGEKFMLTGEEAWWYKGDPDERDVCGWKSAGHSDFLTRCFIHLIRWIQAHVLGSMRRKHKRTTTQRQTTARLRTSHLMDAMDTLSCLLASAALAVTIRVLAVVKPLKLRIAVIAVFGTLFVLLLKLMAGQPSRGEVFGATAAFYAVAAVFVSSTNGECPCT